MTIALHEAFERRPTAQLVPYARNSNTHPEAQLAQLAASFREFGFTIPVLVDEGDGIIAGPGRVIVAERLGRPEVSVIVARGWSNAQIRAYVIADNKIPRGSEFDIGILTAEVVDLHGIGFDLDSIGFSGDELLALLNPPPPPEPKARARRRSRGGPELDLDGERLDAAIAEIEAGHWNNVVPLGFEPSTSWAQFGPIMFREQIDLRCKPGENGSPDVWTANAPGFLKESHTDPRVAGLRAVLAKHRGAAA